MSWVEFMECCGVIFVDWDDYDEKYPEKASSDIGDRLYDCVTINRRWTFADQFIDPISSNGTLTDWISDLSLIVSFLQKEDIPWKGLRVPFRVDEEYGVLVVTSNVAYIVYVEKDANTRTEIHSLGNKEKLI